MKRLIAVAALAAAAVGSVHSAAAQTSQDAKLPFDITSDRGETHASDCTAVWSGSAEALQGSSRLRADTMITHLEIKKGKAGAPGAINNACGDMVSLEAKGSVYYVSAAGRRVHGDNGFYDAASKTITITGDVTAVDGQNVMRGTKMVYNMDTGEGHVEGGGKGAGARNRPRGVFYPKDAGDQGEAGAKPRKAAK